jgi:hypothetical protein
MVIRRDGSIISLEAAGAPLGIFADSSYEQGTVELNPGDLILAYTNGMIDAASPAESEWGVEGLRKTALLAGSAIGGIRETQEMLDFCAEHGITSDIERIPVQHKGHVKYRFVIDMASLK